MSLIVLSLAAPLHAASFVPGDVVVYRVGDGASALSNSGAAVFLDEYNLGGILVQSIALPTTASGSNQPLVASGTATSEGQLSRSSDDQYLLLTGYDSTLPGAASLAGTPAATVQRTVGRVKFDGSVDTSTALTDFADSNNPRSAASTDGMNLWVGGGAGGVRYVTLGSTTSVQVSTDSKNVRYVNIFDGQLYMSTQKGMILVGSVGTGMPMTSGQSITNLPGLASSGTPDAFFFADLDGTPGVDTLYVADDTGGLEKFSLLSGKWFSNGTVGAGSDAYRGVTGAVSGATVTLFATRDGSGNGDLVTLVDGSGFNGTLSGVPTLVASAASNEAFRGVAMAPMGAGPPPATVTSTPTATVNPSTATPSVAATPTGTLMVTNTVTGTPTATETSAPSPPVTDTPVPTGVATPSPTAVPTSPATASFTPGDLAVYRVGDGVSALINTGNAVFIDEYTPGGTLVQSIALPTTASGSNQPLVASGSAASEGQLGRSVDGQYVLLTGYDSTLPGASSLSASPAAVVPRVVGRVKFDGSVDTSTALTDFADGNNPRGAIGTDGTNLWAVGAAGGVRYAALGSTTSTQVNSDSANNRYVTIFDGQLYVSSQKLSVRVGTVGSGTPPTSGQITTNLPGFPITGSPEAFFFADLSGGTVLYVVDDTAGLEKFSLVGGSWVANGTAGTGTDLYNGLTGSVSGNSVTLYATRKASELAQLVDDSGFNGTLSGSPTLLATVGTNEAFRGVALAPAGSGLPSATSTPTVTETPVPTGSATLLPTQTPSLMPTSTASAVATATITAPATAIGTPLPTTVPTLTETPTGQAPACVGDCDGNGMVTVAELVTGVNIALSEASLLECPEFDCDNTQRVSVACLIQGVNAALNGCPK